MNPRTLLIIAGVISALYGIAFIFAPTAILGNVSAETAFTGKFIGALHLGWATAYFLSLNATDSRARKAIFAGSAVFNFVEAVLLVLGLSSGAGDADLYVSLAIHGLLALAFAYFFSKEKAVN